MTPHQYLNQVIGRHLPSPLERARAMRAFTGLSPLLRRWAHTYLATIRASGSFAKGTAIRGDTDLDIFVSLKPDAPGSLADLYYHLDAFLRANGLGTEPRNVSIRVVYEGLAVDIVPGRRRQVLGATYSLYSNRSRSWIQTNVDAHIKLIRDSPRRRPICLTKIWRQLHSLDFPSFYLELVVLEALKHKSVFSLADNMLATLAFLGSEFPARRLVDPANTNNIVSDDLTVDERERIAASARASLQETDWARIVW